MKVLILEDEQMAANRLKQLVAAVAPDAVIVGMIETVKEALEWFDGHPQPDLIISDIQLADGISFDIFSRRSIHVPVIFTTAYDVYTLKAFKVNSIDYLLKPIDQEELAAAFAKYRSLDNTGHFNEQLTALMRQLPVSYKSRFMIRQGDRLLTIGIEDVTYIRADDKIVFLYTMNEQKHIIDSTLEELEKGLDPTQFFRLNRSYIASLKAIERISNHFNGRLKVEIAGCGDGEIFVSRERSGEFKRWLGG